MQASKLSYDLERTGNRMNSPNQVKATGRGKKMGRLR